VLQLLTCTLSDIMQIDNEGEPSACDGSGRGVKECGGGVKVKEWKEGVEGEKGSGGRERKWSEE